MAVHFVVNSENRKLKEAALIMPLFFRRLELVDFPDYFTHTNFTRGQVFAEIQEAAVCLPDRYVIVETYRPKWPWSKVIGHTDKKYPNHIFVNKNMLDTLEVADYVGNFAHEFMHIIGFKHKTNYPNKYRNLESVPYVIGSLAEAWARALDEQENNQMSMGV